MIVRIVSRLWIRAASDSLGNFCRAEGFLSFSIRRRPCLPDDSFPRTRPRSPRPIDEQAPTRPEPQPPAEFEPLKARWLRRATPRRGGSDRRGRSRRSAGGPRRHPRRRARTGFRPCAACARTGWSTGTGKPEPSTMWSSDCVQRRASRTPIRTWLLTHQDLVASAPTLIFNDNRAGSTDLCRARRDGRDR